MLPLYKQAAEEEVRARPPAVPSAVIHPRVHPAPCTQLALIKGFEGEVGSELKVVQEELKFLEASRFSETTTFADVIHLFPDLDEEIDRQILNDEVEDIAN